MPIYEYHCGACGHEVEALQKIADAPLRKCPECGKRALRRVVSPVSFRLKGGGWYQSGYGAGSKPAAACPSADAGGGCAGCPKAAANE